ncbi:sialate O-acetylesterase-like [Salvelinus fontinalis]|uniref:sialate O-acetylesterase-like n=1 Tax=Salvelinus fontinalis TaxID=8038 RepID=UPI0024859AA3|nr:sialate O-acetylesterase-like [Salvelinus fontinalis]
MYGVKNGGFRFASYYGDHMVLQKAPERAVLWGYGPDDAEVTVFLSGGPVTNNAPAVSVAAGIWKVALVPMEAGGPYNLTAVLQNNHSITITDVLFGDVWLCGGQSNMAFTTSQVFNASEELALVSKFPQVRIFMAALEQSYTELTDMAGVEVPWSVPTAKLLGGGDFKHYSAVCWMFGRHLYNVLKYPIGLVTSCWGGTPVEAWSSPRALQHCDLDRINGRNLDNVSLQDVIHCCLRCYVDFVYICPEVSTYRKASLSEGFPNIRWHQTADYGFAPNLRMKNTFMAVAMDLGDEMSPFGSIHPRDKQDVAYRLSLGARAVAYGEEGVSFQGPFPSRVLVNDQYINVTYDQRVSVTQSKDIFQICCSVVRAPCDSLSLWVPAPILQWGLSAVQVSTNYCSMNNVAGLRYAWRDWPCDFKACPVYSADGVLPAPPFTLIRWPDKQ